MGEVAVQMRSVAFGATGVALRRVHRALDDLAVEPDLTDPARLITEVDRAVARLQAVRLDLLRAADTARIADECGASGTAAWLAGATRADASSASRDLKLATDLADSLPVTRDALAQGQVSTEHARVIATATGQLPATLSDTERATIETALVERAKTVDPGALRRAARRALTIAGRTAAEVDAHEDAVVRSEEDRALERVWEAFRVNPDQWPHRYGTAFVELLEHLPTDRLSGKVNATVLVTLDADTLRDQARAVASSTDTGTVISAGTARRLACTGGLVPLVLGGASHPLDLGRTARFFTEHQRTALAARYDTCAAQGCDRPYAWTELHHQHPWSRGGPTNLDQAVPLCGHHHRLIHHADYRHRIDTDPRGVKALAFHWIS